MIVIPRSDLFQIISKEEFWHKGLSLEIVKNISDVIQAQCSIPFITDEHSLKILRAELFRLKSKALKAKIKGGNQFKKFQNEIRLSKYSWDVQINQENTQQVFEAEKAKYEKLLAEKETEKNDLLKEKEMEKENLEKTFLKYIRENNVQKTEDVNVENSLKRKPFEDLTPAGKTKRRKQETELCKTSLSFLEERNVKLVSVTILRNGKEEVLQLYETTDKENIEIEKAVEDLNTLIYIMDSFNISKESYHELSMVFKSLPRTYAVNKILKDLNSKYDIQITPDGQGVQQSLQKHLQDVLSHKLKADKNFARDGLVKIKISGDGTNVGKRIHVVNVTFTIVNENCSGSAHGNYPLLMIRTKERYSDLDIGLADLRREVDLLQGAVMTVEERKFKIEIMLGGDYKFLLIVCGIPSIACQYFCLYCKCNKNEKRDLSHTWSMTDPSKGARLAYTFHETTCQQGNRKSRKKCSDTYSVSNKPLFTSINPDRVVIDHLHMFLRITDKLFNLLIADLRCMDNISSNSTFTSVEENRHRLAHVSKLECILQMLGITFELKVNTENKKLEYRDLTGPEKLLLLKHFDASEFYEDTERASSIQKLWDGFRELYECIKCETPNAEEIEVEAKSWCELYVDCYQARDITPYIHLLRYHVGELTRKHGTLARYSQQGLEKLNDLVTKQFFRGSSHKGTAALKQVMERQNRLTFLEHSKRCKETRKCLKCKETNHNASKCPRI